MEELIQGYCRAIDAARTVFLEDGEADCAYPNCVHCASCEIAKAISDRLDAEKVTN